MSQYYSLVITSDSLTLNLDFIAIVNNCYCDNVLSLFYKQYHHIELTVTIELDFIAVYYHDNMLRGQGTGLKPSHYLLLWMFHQDVPSSDNLFFT